ncbi:BQ5605_C011g06327 [Microbotryum silenes-dioicae]|uniref:BQ5605_C011g06327 protein n=1 Tax=Microbotryum silenes-dioicae TaxID=796604 RepID=A0A2X0MHP1_9BASI|nr:BQ5605_C011g06327 [Microbotryum silenes-dioicae]
MSPFLDLTLPPFGPAARSPEPTGSRLSLLLKQLLGLVSLVCRSEPYHRLSR